MDIFERLVKWLRSLLEALFTPEGLAQIRESANGGGADAGPAGDSGNGSGSSPGADPGAGREGRRFWDSAGGRTMGIVAERRQILFFGRVQGVGFRYHASNDARALGLTGWVENLDDGSVRMEVQGVPAAIDYMLSNLEGHRWIRIDGIESKIIPLLEEESSFRVKGY